MPVVFRHKCGQRISLSIDMAGKTGKCPQCGGLIVIPDRQALMGLVENARERHLGRKEKEEVGKPSPAPPKDIAPAADKKKPVPPAPLPKPEVAAVSERAVETHSGEDSKTGKCPNCDSEVDAGAVICVNCGMNLKTGEKLKTVSKDAVEKKTPDSEDKSEAPPSEK